MTTASAEVQAAVDRLGASLGRAVLVEDVHHHPIWWSAQGEVDGTRMRTILQREPPRPRSSCASGWREPRDRCACRLFPKRRCCRGGACRCASAAICSATCGSSTPTKP
jgi:hypothetical protein